MHRGPREHRVLQDKLVLEAQGLVSRSTPTFQPVSNVMFIHRALLVHVEVQESLEMRDQL